ncbi:MAG: multidrug efflux SMR transporter [Gammaproteobacteria bacterium]|nr:multidrug efflux SMR transporter [Gammaproteobacteria bacterium]
MTLTSSWFFLAIAILFGVLGTVSMKLSQGLKKWKPFVSLAIFYVISFIALTLAIKGIDMSIVYAIWSGVGTVLVAIIGFFIFNEPITFRKIISLLLIVIGVLGIHLNNVSIP